MSYGLQAPDLSLVGGGVSGAIVTVIVGMIMNAMNNDLPVQPTRAPCRKDFEPVRHVRFVSKADSLRSTVLCLLYPRKPTSQRLCGREDL
jgi:hypothetical protein